MEMSIAISVFIFLELYIPAYFLPTVQHFGKDSGRLSIACVGYGLKKTAVCGKQWGRQRFLFLVPAKNQL